ncbi:MAG: hypothetical protein HY067_10430 [Betaproteobacteria bacterium]|nr:hypothetical protein [Betaproteobacteria bacterium]
MAVRKILIALALLSLVATNANAHDGWNGHYYHGGGGRYFWWGAAVGAALTLPFYYSQTWAEPGPYYYYYPGPTVYVQNPPVYVQSQPTYTVTQAQPANAVTQTPNNGVIELGPVSALPPANSISAPNPDASQAPAGQWFVYPSKGQSPQQQANDRYACNRLAINESGYDPDLRSHRNPDTGPAAYGRALSACLEGRGYAVR